MDPLTAIFNIGSTIIDKIWPDKDKADAAKLEMFKLQQQGAFAEIQNGFNLMIENIKVNANEALHSSIFVAGWRPFIGWVCGIALAYNYIAMPFIVWITKCFYPEAPAMPALDMTELMVLLGGMLGIAGLRSREITQGKR
uniref:Putative holin n=1 Tax=viral metagenome TaxID=1070528 RepID=A0A6H2A2F8_9ZZZZ